MTLALRARLLQASVAAAVVAAVAVACTTSTTTTVFPPITGIEIQASSLFAGIGCGITDAASAAPMAYRYAVLISYAVDGGVDSYAVDGGVDGGSTPLLASNIYDCFADGVFENIPNGTNDNLNFNVDIFAYDFDDYNRVLPALPPILSCVPGADACPPSSFLLSLGQLDAATWKVHCTATELAGVPVLAICPPLVPIEGGAAMSAADGEAEAGPDATMPAEAEAPDTGAGPDGGPDAGPDAAPDASDAAAEPPEAGDAGDAAADAPSDG